MPTRLNTARLWIAVLLGVCVALATAAVGARGSDSTTLQAPFVASSAL